MIDNSMLDTAINSFWYCQTAGTNEADITSHLGMAIQQLINAVKSSMSDPPLSLQTAIDNCWLVQTSDTTQMDRLVHIAIALQNYTASLKT
jgi:hypothetical protein